MWKKILVLLISLIGTFSVTFTIHNTLFADTTNGGYISGRLRSFVDKDILATGITNSGYAAKGTLDMRLLKKNPAYGDTVWFSMSVQPVSPEISALTSLSGSTWSDIHYYSSAQSNIKKYITSLNSALSSYPKENALFYERTIPTFPYGKSQDPDQNEKKFFTLFGWEYLSYIVPLGVSVPDLHAGYPYWLGNTTGWPNYQGMSDSFLSWGPGVGFHPVNAKAYVRPSAYFDFKNMVFAVSDVYQSDSTKDVQEVNNTTIEKMKLRLKNTASPMRIDMDSITMKGYSVKKIKKDATIDIAYQNASAISSVKAALIFEHKNTNEFAYYKPLDSISAVNGMLSNVSLKGIDEGIYNVYLILEEDTKTNSPIYSSELVNPIVLEIADPAYSATITPTSNLVYKANTKKNDVVANVTIHDGIAPFNYTLVADSTHINHAQDYQNFKIDVDHNGDIKILVDKADGLEAGDYYFRFKVVDAIADPINGYTSDDIHIHVAKISPDLKFKTTDAIDKVIGDVAFTEEFTHKNTDTSDALFKLTYSSSITNVATVDTPSSNTDTDVKITPAAVNGTSMIEVKLAETKNFTADSATLIVNVHPKISLVFTADKNSFAVSEVVNAGTKIGSVTLSGNSPQYTYSMAVDPDNPDAGANNALFDVRTTGKTNATSMDIITKSPNVPQGTYKITIKAEDVYGQIAYAKGTIKIAGMAQTGFEFYDYRNVSTKLTNETLTIYYGEDSAKLFAKGGQSSGLSYAPDDSTQTVLSIDPTDGTITTNDIGKIKVKATKPADGTYSEAVIYMYVEVKPCEQEINFDKTETTTISYDNENGHSFFETATGNIKTGMPNAGEDGEGTISYTLGGTDKDIASIDTSTGKITIHAGQNIITMKTFTVTAKLNDGDAKNEKYGSASKTKTINVYPAGSASWTQTNKPQADNNTGTEKLGDLTVTGGSGNASFSISTSGDVDNLDKEFFDIDPSSGEVVLIKLITVVDIASKTYNTTEKAYEMHVMVDINDGGSITTEHLIIYIEGAERANLDFKNKDNITQEITEVYDVNKSFQLSLNQSIQGISYRISTNPSHQSPSDVISLNASGKVDIQNANEVSISGSTIDPVYVEAVVPPSAGYKEIIVEAPVRIKRASQTLVFSQNPINTTADIQSLNITMSGHKDGNKLVYSSSDSKVKAIADPTNSDTFTIKPNAVVKNGITITAIAQGDRNYKDDLKTATLNIAQAGTNQFTAIFPSMTYGDAGPFKVVIAPAGSGNETYTYTVKDTNIVEIDASGNITPHHAGTTMVDVTQTSAGGTVGPYSFTITVDPKPITITIEDKEKYTGMQMPEFTVNVPSEDVVAGDTIPLPEFHCVDKNEVDVDKDTGEGIYEITGSYSNPPSDYDITVIDGELTIHQDSAAQSWYELQDVDGNQTSSSVWHKDAVDVVIKQATGSAGTYDQIAKDTKFSNQDLTRFTVTEEGETSQDIYFRINPNGSDPNKGSVSLPVQDTIRIDSTDPTITSITGKNKGSSQLRMLFHAITFGQFFKPGMVVTIHAQDIEPSQGIPVSGIQKVFYKISKLDEQGNAIGTPNTMDQNDTTVELSLTENGAYEVCAVAMDKAGNESPEKCEVMKIRTWGESSDENEIPDINIDVDGDGVADINITRPGEKKPYLNIDTNGDGIPEINISRAGEEVVAGKTEPYLNIMDPRVKWNPIKEIDYDEDGVIDFRTDETLSAILSMDSNNDKIPDLNIDINDDYVADLNINVDGKYISAQTNIDSTGDGNADINIDIEGDGKPDQRIASNYIWNPMFYVKDKDGKIIYGTTADIEIDKIDSITDKGIIVKPEKESDKFLPNYALKVKDITSSISEREQKSILDKQENMEIENVYELVMMEDEKSIQPDGSVEVSIPYDGKKENVVVLLKNAKGEWEEVSFEIKGTYLQFKTAYLGEVSILKSKGEVKEPTREEPTKPTDQKPNAEKPSTSVQGSYTTQGGTSAMGGAYTGDASNTIVYIGIFALTGIFLFTLIRSKHSQS